MSRTALVVVDVQKDFCEGGRLAVEGGNEVAHRIAAYAYFWREQYDEILFTKDFHNDWPDTNGGHFSDTPDFVDSWPVHCEASSDGANFHEAIRNIINTDNYDPLTVIFYKGQGRPDYSGFQGKNDYGWTLAEYLEARDILNVDVVGIAGDYCVRQTALDAKSLGYTVNVLAPMVASVGGDEATRKTISEVNA